MYRHIQMWLCIVTLLRSVRSCVWPIFEPPDKIKKGKTRRKMEKRDIKVRVSCSLPLGGDWNRSNLQCGEIRRLIYIPGAGSNELLLLGSKFQVSRLTNFPSPLQLTRPQKTKLIFFLLLLFFILPITTWWILLFDFIWCFKCFFFFYFSHESPSIVSLFF